MKTRVEFLEQLVQDIKDSERSSQRDVLYCRASGALSAFYSFDDITHEQFLSISSQIQNAFDEWSQV